MSWAARFELRQYFKGSLWVVPLVGGVHRARHRRHPRPASRWPPVWGCCSSTSTASPTVYARSRWPRSSDRAGLDVLEDWTAQIRARARARDESDAAAAPPGRGPVWHVPAR